MLAMVIVPLFGIAQSCPCEFEVEVEGIVPALRLKPNGYRYYGKGVKPKRVGSLWKTDSISGSVTIEPTRQWFIDHSACGNDQYCVEKVTYQRLVLDVDPPWADYQRIYIRVKLRKRE